jgi:large subunit ribosomal protein L31
MKKDVHPEYRKIVFRDASSDFILLTSSTVKTTETYVLDGVTYPSYLVDITSASHPFFTGKQRIMDTAGRIDRFKKKFNDKVAVAAKSSVDVKAAAAAKKSAVGSSIADKLKALKEKAEAERNA